MSNISGIVGPTATGFAVQYLGGYASASGIASPIAAAGAVAMAPAVRRPAEPAHTLAVPAATA